jgi:hypothetical protein
LSHPFRKITRRLDAFQQVELSEAAKELGTMETGRRLDARHGAGIKVKTEDDVWVQAPTRLNALFLGNNASGL